MKWDGSSHNKNGMFSMKVTFIQGRWEQVTKLCICSEVKEVEEEITMLLAYTRNLRGSRQKGSKCWEGEMMQPPPPPTKFYLWLTSFDRELISFLHGVSLGAMTSHQGRLHSQEELANIKHTQWYLSGHLTSCCWWGGAFIFNLISLLL